MNIVVLLKAVPVVGTERLGNDQMTDRSGQLEANGNDEYLLEKALKLTEEHGGEVTLLTVGPATARTTHPQEALAMGAARAVHVVDNARQGSDIRRVDRCSRGGSPQDGGYAEADCYPYPEHFARLQHSIDSHHHVALLHPVSETLHGNVPGGIVSL